MSEEKFLHYINTRELENSNITLQKPTILKFIQGFDDEMKNGESLKYFKPPTLDSYPIHLNAGAYFDDSDGRSKVNSIGVLELFIRERDLCNYDHDRIKVFTQRRVLAFILQAPYNRREFSINVVRHGNIIFMTLEKWKNKWKYHRESTLFAQICETDSFIVESDSKAPGNENQLRDESRERSYFIYGTKYEKYDVFYTSKAISVWSEKPIEKLADMDVLNNCCFVLTKLVNVEITTYWIKTYPALIWWSHGFLSNIDNIFIGCVDNEGVVNKPAILQKVDSIRKAQNKRSKVCQAFLQTFLMLVEESTSADDSLDLVYVYHFDGKGNVAYSIQKGDPFLSKDFMEYMRNQ